MTKLYNAPSNGVPFTRGSAISRRGLLAGALGTAAAVGLAACSPGSAGAPGTQQSTVAGSGGAETYDGPKVSLAYWNGLTGGDGPIMKDMMNDFNAAHPNIVVSMTAIATEFPKRYRPFCER